MSNGFGGKNETKQQFIKNFFKTSKQVKCGFNTVEEARSHESQDWFEKYRFNSLKFTDLQLLQPEHKVLKAGKPNDNIKKQAPQIFYEGYSGYWRVQLYERQRSGPDFDIAVNTGGCFRFHPEVIRENICVNNGREIYNQWRRIVTGDLESLRALISHARGSVDKPAWSYTCSDSAVRLCRRVGLKVHQGVAFLFPNSYQ